MAAKRRRLRPRLSGRDLQRMRFLGSLSRAMEAARAAMDRAGMVEDGRLAGPVTLIALIDPVSGRVERVDAVPGLLPRAAAPPHTVFFGALGDEPPGPG